MQYLSMTLCLALCAAIALCAFPGMAGAEDAPPSLTDKMSRRMIDSFLSQPPTAAVRLTDPAGDYRFAGVQNMRLVGMMTGEDTPNATLSRFGVGGTDLGYIATLGDTTYFFFGDTHVAHDAGSLQKHNAVAFTKDMDYTDGIALDGMLMEADGREFREIIPTNASGVLEVASIPGGAVALGDTLYVSYMSVKFWTNSNWWPSNFGSFYKSDNQGKTWERVRAMTWGEETNFIQNCPLLVGDTVYVLGTGSGRGNPMSLMRVAADQFENYDAYEYLTGYGPDGSPVFEKGEAALRGALHLLPDCGEFTALFSEYLGEWIVMLRSTKGTQISATRELWGPYSQPIDIYPAGSFLGYDGYGTVLNPRWVSADGSKIGFLMSIFWPVYNVGVYELELLRK